MQRQTLSRQNCFTTVILTITIIMTVITIIITDKGYYGCQPPILHLAWPLAIPGQVSSMYIQNSGRYEVTTAPCHASLTIKSFFFPREDSPAESWTPEGTVVLECCCV